MKGWVKGYSPTQVAVLRAIAALDPRVVESKDLDAMTHRRITEATMRVLVRRGAIRRGTFPGMWVMLPAAYEQLRTAGVVA